MMHAGQRGASYDISMHATDSVILDAEPAVARGGVLLRNAPRVSAAHARLTRLIGQGLQLPLPLPGAQLTLRLDQGAELPWSEVLSLSGPMGVFEIAQGARLLNALTGIDLAGLEPDGGVYPEWFVSAVSGRLTGTPFQGINRISCVDRTVHAAASTLQLSMFQQGHEIAMPLRAAATTWLQLLAGARRWPLRLPLAPYLGLASVNTVCIGRHDLPRSVLSKLEVGDIVLPRRLYFATDGSGTTRLAGRHWQVRYQAPCNLHIIAQENRLDTEDTFERHQDMAEAKIDADAEAPSVASDPVPASPAAAAGPEPEYEPDSATAALLDEVHMTLSFELGRVSLPLAEIRSLGPATVLTLQGGGADAIAILCSGRAIGRGEAVDVDGALGIRITQWGGAC
ncbi:type III secretion system cytoplasmic ring protein SctQ [Herbaspirillum sp. RV1423]|uniref:type III secretion system cytoplasmic ring protein SctQ n=1 Tax=Herbaspirillum sp. RV1423 TaxID=1443993 RepID=UPI0018CC03AD|nr:type III secretion system cytoplasmic ring protein SctQ [Herbaspirillum sp. RV1423]